MMNEVYFAINDFYSFWPTVILHHMFAIFLFKKWLGPKGTLYACLSVLGLCLFLNLRELHTLTIEETYYYLDFSSQFECLNFLGPNLVFCVDTLALTVSALVLMLAMLALYFGVECTCQEAFTSQLTNLLSMFATSVIFLFFCYDYFLIILTWECISLLSFLLLSPYITKGVLSAFVFSRISDMFMFIAFLFTVVVFNSTDLSMMFLQTPFMAFRSISVCGLDLHFLTAFSVSLVLAVGMKVTQFFVHVWLSDAKDASTPVSALMHSSTLVVAGAYLMLSHSIVFEFTPLTNDFLTVVGSLALAFGALAAVLQNDIKKLVAYAAVSHVGYLVCGYGLGYHSEFLVYLVAHTLNQSFLFVLVGYTVHFFNTDTDTRQMSGPYAYSFDIYVFLFMTCFILSGFPYSAWFLGSEIRLAHFPCGNFSSLCVQSCGMLSFFFTPIYMFKLIYLVLSSTNKGALPSDSSARHIPNSRPAPRLASAMDPKLEPRSNWAYANSLLSSFVDFVRHPNLASRFTSYELALLWYIVLSLGELLMLKPLNYGTLVDMAFLSSSNPPELHSIYGDTAHVRYGEFMHMVLLLVMVKALAFLGLHPSYRSYSKSFKVVESMLLAYTLIPLPKWVIALLLLWLIIGYFTSIYMPKPIFQVFVSTDKGAPSSDLSARHAPNSKSCPNWEYVNSLRKDLFDFVRHPNLMSRFEVHELALLWRAVLSLVESLVLKPLNYGTLVDIVFLSSPNPPEPHSIYGNAAQMNFGVFVYMVLFATMVQVILLLSLYPSYYDYLKMFKVLEAMVFTCMLIPFPEWVIALLLFWLIRSYFTPPHIK